MRILKYWPLYIKIAGVSKSTKSIFTLTLVYQMSNYPQMAKRLAFARNWAKKQKKKKQKYF